ncbi:MAG: type II secretion system F family protein [Candidatus Peregrinibacteria bacterium]|nr:type II secretion system F family protein [Candidatus Peregrinibacteria bacterium]
MPKFEYVLTTNGGKHEDGELFAQDRETAIRKLQTADKIILSCNEITKGKHEWFWEKPSLSSEDLLMFTKYLAAMITAGITIAEAFDIIISQTKDTGSKKMFENITMAMRNGQTMSKSLALYPNVFSEIYVNMIGIGEESGTLEQALNGLEVQLEKDADLRSKIKAAFIYPIIILIVTLLMAFGIVIFIMPKVMKIFTTFKVDLPLPTRMLIWGTNNVWLILATTIVAIIVIIFLFKFKFIKKLWNKLALHFPIFGNILIKTYLARFSRTIHSLLQSGIVMTKALQIASETIGSETYKDIIIESKQKVEQGGSLSSSLESHPKYFPTIMAKMLMVGEKTGSMEKAVSHLANLYEKEVDNITKNLSVLLEPLLLIFMATIVGGLAISIIMPIYQLPNLISK